MAKAIGFQLPKDLQSTLPLQDYRKLLICGNFKGLVGFLKPHEAQRFEGREVLEVKSYCYETPEFGIK